ncbi:MAG: fasciclin domain-containing protein [Actinomycetota bacterium]
MSLLEQIADALGSTDNVSSLMGGLRVKEDAARGLIGSAVPAVLAGLGSRTDGEGAAALHGVTTTDGGGLAASIGALFEQGDSTGSATKLVDAVFGKQRGAVESQIGSESGVEMSAVSRFLPMATAAVMSLLAKFGAEDGLDAEGMAEQLAAIGADGAMGDILAQADDDDRSGFVAGMTAVGAAGGLAALAPATNIGTGATAAIAGAAGGEPAAGAATTSSGLGRYDVDADRTGLGWLLPAVLLAGGLILGLILWQCGNSEIRQPSLEVSDEVEAAESADGDSGDGDSEATASDEESDEASDGTDADAESESAAAEPTATPEPEPTATPEPEPEPTPAPTPTPEPDPTLAALASATPELSTLLTVAADLGLDGLLADPDAGPFTIFAPTNDAFDGASEVLGRLDGDQLASTVGFHVVPGVITSDQVVPGAEFVTSTSEVLRIGDDGSVPGGGAILSADISAANGIVHVIEGVMVPGSVQRGLATADINALFELEPIQFSVGSAEILAESVPTLDAAVAVLLEVPQDTRLEVQGHTDTDGGEDANQALSEARANSVVTYLTGQGVDPEILSPVGYGETDLKIEPEVTAEDKAQNRRIEFVDITDL